MGRVVGTVPGKAAVPVRGRIDPGYRVLERRPYLPDVVSSQLGVSTWWIMIYV